MRLFILSIQNLRNVIVNIILTGGQGMAAGDPSSTVVGRGSRRGGGRVLPEQTAILRTRPVAVESKKGMYILQL